MFFEVVRLVLCFFGDGSGVLLRGNSSSGMISLGQGSIATKKSEVDRKLEFLGWTIDLDARTITLCNRNLHKSIHVLFSFGESGKVSVAHLQRIASLTSRAAILNRLMKPFTHELHAITSRYTQSHIRL